MNEQTLTGCWVRWLGDPRGPMFDERVEVTRTRALYLLRAARSRGDIDPVRRIVSHTYRIGNNLILWTHAS